MTAEMGTPFSPDVGIDTDEPSALSTDPLDVSCPHGVIGKLHAGNSEDQAVIRRWRLGFFAFYGATTLLLCGLALIGNRPEMNAGATTSRNPIVASSSSR